MSSIAVVLLSYLLLYKYWLLFVIVFLAAVALPFPVNTLVLASGAFASQGYFSFWISLCVVVAANILGDVLDYVLAARYGPRVMKKLRIPEITYLVAVETYVRKHPGLTIFLTRFTGTLDPIVNVLSGLVGIPILVFLFYDTIGNVVSLGSVLLIGYIVGNNWMTVSGLLSTFGWLVSVFFILLTMILIFGRRIGLFRLPFLSTLRRLRKDVEKR